MAMLLNISMEQEVIPPLSQSKHEKMACPESYIQGEVNGKHMPDNLFSDRGTEIHKVMAQYVQHCTEKGVPADWSKFDELAKAAGPEAGRILDGMRENYVVDYDHVIMTETTMMLTKDFEPIFKIPDEALAAYEGTPDVVLVLDEKRAKIEDYKSHPRPFDADTFQSKLYPFFVFMYMPEIEEVTFELIFVRYRNARRSVTYTRDQVPALMVEIERARERQIHFHEMAANGEELPVLPGNHCVYCPMLAATTCPIRELNIHANLPIGDRMRFHIWAEMQRKQNIEVLKAHVDANGPVRVYDGKGQAYEYGPHASEGGYYPLVSTLLALNKWKEMGGEDPFLWDLRVASTQIKSKLKSPKRADLDQWFRDTVLVKETKTPCKLTRPNDGEYHDEEEEQ